MKRWPRRCFACPQKDMETALAGPVGRAVLRASKTWQALEAGLQVSRTELDCLEHDALLKLRTAIEDKRERMAAK